MTEPDKTGKEWHRNYFGHDYVEILDCLECIATGKAHMKPEVKAIIMKLYERLRFYEKEFAEGKK